MARAELYIEDDEDGNVSLVVRYIGGNADPKSPAHQLANACRLHLEANLTQVGKPEIEVAPADVAPQADSGSAPREGAIQVVH